MRKILEHSEVIKICANYKKVGKSIVQCHGVFDILHIGHIRHLNAAKNHGDVLIVSVTCDRFVNKGPNKPIFSEMMRAEMLAALECAKGSSETIPKETRRGLILNELPNHAANLKG